MNKISIPSVKKESLPVELLSVLEQSPEKKIYLEIKDGQIYYTIPAPETFILLKEAQEEVFENLKGGWTRKDFFDEFRKTQNEIEKVFKN